MKRCVPGYEMGTYIIYRCKGNWNTQLSKYILMLLIRKILCALFWRHPFLQVKLHACLQTSNERHLIDFLLLFGINFSSKWCNPVTWCVSYTQKLTFFLYCSKKFVWPAMARPKGWGGVTRKIKKTISSYSRGEESPSETL